MIKRLLPLLLLAAPLTAAPAKATKILFIGNSYTYVNKLPTVVALMGLAGKKSMDISSYTAGATALIQFWEEKEHAKARTLVKKGHFNYVILQDQSVTPCNTPEWTLTFGGKWCQLAKQNKSKPIFFITWAHISPDGTSFSFDMQDELTATYHRAAQENGARCAPVGEAWRLWYTKHPDIRLHAEDGSHPNAMGTYLAGCVFYSTLTGKSSVGLPATLSHEGKTFLSVPSEHAKELQQMADRAVAAEKKYAAQQAAAAKAAEDETPNKLPN